MWRTNETVIRDLVIFLPPLVYLPSPAHHLSVVHHREHAYVYTSPSTSRKHFSNGGKRGKGRDAFHLLASFIALLRGRPLPLAPTLLLTVVIPMLAVPPPIIPVVILVVLRRTMAVFSVSVVPRGPVTVLMIISSMILPSPTVMVPVPVPFTVTVAVAVSFPILLAVIMTTVTIPVSFAVPFVLAVLIFVFSILRGFLAFTAGGGPSVLGSFLLAKPFLLPFDELGKGGLTGLFIFKGLVLAQVFKEWDSLNGGQANSSF